MAEFKKKNRRSFWHSPLMLGVLFFLFILFAYKMINLIEKERETHQKKLLVMEQIDNLNQRQETLSEDIAKLNTEEGIEDIIREKYQVAKKGEKMVVIVEEEKGNFSPEVIQSHGFWNWLKNIFNK